MFRNRLLRRISLAIVVILLVAASIFIYRVNSRIGDIGLNTSNPILHEDDIKDIEEREAAREEASIDQPEEKPEDFYMLLIGLDMREDIFTLNTDSLIVSHVIPQHNIMKLISLPRDLRIINLRQQPAKLNSVFADGYQHAVQEARKDPSLLSGTRVTIGPYRIHEEYISSGSVVLRETIEKFLDIDIEHTFLVNFQTVTSLVDEVGGINIYVDRYMEYDDPTDNTHIHLEKGWQILNGEDALNFSRFREDNRGPEFYSSDFERGMRQQKVIMALANELSSWTNITRIFNLLDIISTNFKTDMSRSEMISLIRKFHGNINSDSIISVPFEGTWRSPFVYIDDETLEQVKQDFKSIDLPQDEDPPDPDSAADS